MTRKNVLYGTMLFLILFIVLSAGLSYLLTLPAIPEEPDSSAGLRVSTTEINQTNSTYYVDVTIASEWTQHDPDLRNPRVVAYAESCEVIADRGLSEVTSATDLYSQPTMTVRTDQRPAYIVLESSRIGNLTDSTVINWEVTNTRILDNGTVETYRIRVDETANQQYKPFPYEGQIRPGPNGVPAEGDEECRPQVG